MKIDEIKISEIPEKIKDIISFIKNKIIKVINKTENNIEKKEINKVVVYGEVDLNKDTVFINCKNNKKDLGGIKIPILDFIELNPNIDFTELKDGDEIIINEEIKNQNEISIISIGDSNGSLETYLWNFENSNLIDENSNWIGGNKKVIVHGDILADRSKSGFDILLKNRELREQAQKEGGDITIIAGNHDDFMFSFLLKRGGVHKNGIYALEEQEVGLLELMEFSKHNKEILEFGIFEMPKYREEILKNMRESKKGKILLEEMCNMKLCEKIDDILFIHTDPSKEILKMINDFGINEINKDFKNIMENSLLNGGEFDKDNNYLFDTFLNTKNRNIEKLIQSGDWDMEEEIEKIKKLGIKRIVFGHSDVGEANRITEINGIKIINVDQSSLKKIFGDKIKTVSAAGFSKSGNIVTGRELKNK